MNKIILIVTFVLISFQANAQVNIFACEPEWESLALEIGGKNVKTVSATNAQQDPHYIRAKPSLIAKIRKADLLICSGAELEVGWLPILLSHAKRTVQHGNIGFLMASEFVETIEKPTNVSRANGDLHIEGNPHIHLDPYNILLVAKEINNRLQKIDPKNSKTYQNNYASFSKKWNNAIKGWERKIVTLRNMGIVVHHKSFSYLIKWMKLNEVATLESKPGIAPTSGHLREILVKLDKQSAQFIIRTPFDSTDASQWLNKKTGIKELVLPFTINGNTESTNLFLLFDSTINLLMGKTS